MIARVIRLPPVLFLLSLAGAWVLQALFPFRLGMPSFAFGMTAGSLVILTAVAIAGAALFEMKRHRTTVEPWQRPSHLVTGGVFAFTRNPLYLSLLLIVVALGVMADALWFAIAAGVLGVVLDRVVIRWEERMLEDVFADHYAAYKRRVRRWV